MSKSYSRNKKLFIALFIRYSKETGRALYPVHFTFYSSSTKPRNLNDIAARYARTFGIGWDHLVIRDAWGKTYSQRYRMDYQCLIK